MLLLPTVVLNGAMWGQADSTYAALCVAGLYHLLCRRPVRAGVYFGLALAFKLQTVFASPPCFSSRCAGSCHCAHSRWSR